METAKVDVRKLQLLNDRINQCLDALNQVRLSVHGLSHTQATPQLGQFGANPQGAGSFNPGFGYGMTPIGQGFGQGFQGFGQGVQGFGGGLSHTPYTQPQLGAFPPVNPFNVPNLPQVSQFPLWNVPIGLSHTGLEAESAYNRPLWADPVLAARVAQTFPYVQLGVPPIVPVY